MKHILIVAIFAAIVFVALAAKGAVAKRPMATPTPQPIVTTAPKGTICMDANGNSGPCPTIDPGIY